ncbi:hypothetical protein [Algoriphagus namhaensis]
MNCIHYTLGAQEPLEQLYPNPVYANRALNFHSFADVISHYTRHSLLADGFQGLKEVSTTLIDQTYQVRIEASDDLSMLQNFAQRHAQLFSPQAGQKAIAGKKLLEQLGVWNPMAGYPVNRNPNDGTSKWTLFPPLGLNMIGQRGLLLMHYPPWAIVQASTFENAMTMQRWGRVLEVAGVDKKEVNRFKTIVDVNPIAAPGSGESEYPNDYFPIMMASGFFDGPEDRDYIKSMLELYLNPPSLPEDSKYTLPLLICGSPLYDPQAPGWFRTAYTDILPADEHQIPQVNVMQAGTFKVRPDSKKETPYLIGNHMIAASVTGRCTDDPSKMPDIRLYEAQDLVAATFLKLCSEDPNLDPAEAKARACQKWFGNPEGTGAPKPKKKEELLICALAQVDLFFEPSPKPHPKYTLAEAIKRCKDASDAGNPCCGDIRPPDRQD